MANLTEKERQSSKQYKREIMSAMVVYMVMIVGSLYLLKDVKGTVWAYPLALSPLIPVYFIIRALVNFVRRSDELIQKIHGESAVITLLVVIFSGFAYGLLMKVGLPQPDIFMAASIICPLYFIVFALVRRKYDMDGWGIGW